jgi:hypothetical protein
MSSIDNNNKTTRQGRLRKLLLGIDKHFANVTQVTIGGAVLPLTELKARIQADIDASDASVQAKADFRVAVQRERDSHIALNPTLRLFKGLVIAQFGDTQGASSTLADFGLLPRKSSKKTVATKSAAVGKAKTTRGMRHTMGKKQKAKVKAPSASTAPATPGAPGAPAVPGAPGGSGAPPTVPGAPAGANAAAPKAPNA